MIDLTKNKSYIDLWAFINKKLTHGKLRTWIGNQKENHCTPFKGQSQVSGHQTLSRSS